MSDEQGIDYNALRGAGPKKKPAPVVSGGAIDYDALAPAAAPALDTGGVDLRDTTKYPSTSSGPAVPAPAPRRGIMQRIGDALKPINDFMSQDRENDVRDAVGLKPVETRTPAVIPDRVTPEQKMAGARRRLDATVRQRPDQTSVLPAGSIQSHVDQARTIKGNADEASLRARFSPAKWREIAQKGMELANQLHAEGKHDEAEDANKKAYNAQLLADGAESADTNGAIALSSLLGIVHDPFAQEKRNQNEIEQAQSTFTPEEQQADLGMKNGVPMRRGFNATKDLTIPAVASLPVFIAGGAAGRAALGGIEGVASAYGAPRVASIARALATEAETAGIYGPKQAGTAGVREAMENFGQNVPTLIRRGATQGQVIGAAQAAREAQQTGMDPVDAAVQAVTMGAPLGVVVDLAGGLASRLAGVAQRTHLTGADVRRGVELPYEKPVVQAVETAREVKGQTPMGDMTAEGQHATIAKALAKVLDEKVAADPTGEQLTADRMVQPVSYPPRAPIGEPDVPLRSALDVANDRVPTPRDESNAVVQMERQRREAAAMAENARQMEEQARIEAAAAASAREKQGPLTLSQTIMRAGKDAEDGDKLALEYKDAINQHVDALARVNETETPTLRDKIALARTKLHLDEMRKKYGMKVGGAALLGAALSRDDLTDDEKKMVGLGAVAMGSMSVMKSLPSDVARSARRVIDNISSSRDVMKTPREWMAQFDRAGVDFGDQRAEILDHMERLAKDAPDGVEEQRGYVDAGEVYHKVLHHDAPLHPYAKKLVDFLREGGTQDDEPGAGHIEDWIHDLDASGINDTRPLRQFMEQHWDHNTVISRPELMRELKNPDAQWPEAQPEPVSRGFSSRAFNYINDRTTFGKKWDQPMPAADWIGKLKSASQFVSKDELATIMPVLEDFRDRKVKLTREELGDIIDTNAPQLERATLADAQPSERRNTITLDDGTEGDPDNITDIDDLESADRETLRQEIANRRARVQQIDSSIESVIENAASEMNYAEAEMERTKQSLARMIREGFPNADADGAVSAALNELAGEIGPDHVPYRAVEKAFDAMVEHGDLYAQDEPHDPESQGLTVDEGEDEHGNPLWTVTKDSDGQTWTAPTREEALAHAEHAGQYEPGTSDYLFPKGFKVELESRRHFKLTTEAGTPHEWSNDYVLPRALHDADPETLRAWAIDKFNLDDNDRLRVEHLPDRTRESWVMRNANDTEIAAGSTREGMVEDFARGRFEDMKSDVDLDSLHSKLEEWANDYANYLDKESTHHWLEEDPANYFESDYAEKEKYEEEIATLSEQHDAINDMQVQPAAEAEPGEPQDMTLLPFIPGVKGRTQFGTYQRIGGGTNYRELITTWRNPPKGEAIPHDAYGPPGENHDYWTKYGVPNAVAHLRAEDHKLFMTLGLDGEKVSIPDDMHPDLKDSYQKVSENRAKRRAILKEMGEIGIEYDSMPAADRNPDSPSTRALELANQYADKNQQAINLGKREDQLAENIRGQREALLGEKQEDPETIAIMLEAQASLAQSQTARGQGSKPPDVDALKDIRDKAEAHADALNRAYYDQSAAVAKTGRELQAWWQSIDRERRQQLLDDVRNASYYAADDLPVAEIDNPGWQRTWDHLHAEGGSTPEERARGRELIDAHREATKSNTDSWRERSAAVDAADDAKKAYRDALGWRDYSPFNDTTRAQQVNVARFLIDAAERGYSKIGWSDGANRIANAMHGKHRAARLWYDEMMPSTFKRVLGWTGFKDVEIKHTYIRGQGHYTIELTPEMRSAIRKYGVPFLGVAAMMGAPDDAEAQDGKSSANPKLYGSLVGMGVAGALIASMAMHKKVRGLVKENAELSRALHLDDLSGVSNKRALTAARDAVDRSPEMSWVTFDADGFKQINDVHGHPEGDKAIAHFGKTIRDAQQFLGVDPIAFRAGGDEFAVAVPKERAAEVLSTIERSSVYTKDGVQTKLTGAIGDTYDSADAALIETKRINRTMTDAQKIEKLMQQAAEQQFAVVRAAGTMKGDLAELEHNVDRMQVDRIIKETEHDNTDGLRFYSNPVGPALKLLKRYPSAVGVVAVGEMMRRDDDNPAIQRAGLPVMALGALSAIGSHRLYAGADWLGSKLVDELRKSPEGTKLVRAFNPDALLAPEVTTAIRDFERERAKGAARAAEFAGKAKQLGPEGDRAVSDVLDNEDWEGAAKQTTDVLAVATELSNEYERLTQAQLAAGTLSPSQVLPNYGGPRRYAFYDAQAALAETPTSAGGAPRNARIVGSKTRTLDLPIRDAEAKLAIAQKAGDPAAITAAQDALDQAKVVQLSQRVERGEIRESSYRAAMGIEKAHSNVASAKLFETLRASPGAVHPEWEAAVTDLMAAKDMFRTATTQADRDAADLMQNEAAHRLDEIVRRFKQKDGAYVSLPDTPGMGMLRGAVVQRDIAHSLEGFDAPHTYGRMLRAWKEIKTVFNVGTHIGNILSNVTALHMGDVPVWLQPYYYTAAMKDLKSYGEATRALTEAGVMNVNSVSALGEGQLGKSMRSREGLEELVGTTRPETRKVLMENGISESGAAIRRNKARLAGTAVGGAVGFAKGYDPDNPESGFGGAVVGASLGAVFHSKRADLIRAVYGHEDNIARLAVFLRRRKLGDTIEQARDAAVSSLGDFRSRSPALRVISSTVSPFIMYQAKAVPAFARNVVDHPWKYLSLMAAWGAMNELGKAEMGEVPEQDKPVNQRQDFGYFFPGTTQLPFGDERGNKAAVDMARWTPISGLTTGAPPGSIPEAFSDQGSSLVTPGGPVIDAALQGSNVDPYTKGPLIKRDRPVRENVGALLNKAADFALPSSLGFHTGRLKEDMDNEDWTKFKNDLLGPMGIKPKYVRPGAVAVDAEYTLERSLRDMKAELRRTLRANKNEERVPELTKKYQRDVAQALANFKERIGVAPSPELVNEFLTP